MNVATFARIANVVALLGFLLPWILVSCANQKLASATGVDLAIGSFTVHNPMNGQVEHHNGEANMPVLWALNAAGLGLLGTFVLSRRAAARWMLGTSLAALVLAFVGVQATHDPQRLKAALGSAQQSNDALSQGVGDAAMATIRVDDQFGYYLAMLGLMAAAGFSSAALYGVDSLRTRAAALGGEATRRLATAAAPLPADPDIAFWDGMTDRNDRDLLREYLLRFPTGRFAELARAKLDRPGAPSQEPAPAAESKASSTNCPQCAEPVEAGANFCEGCGARLTASPLL